MLKNLLISTAVSALMISGAMAQSPSPQAEPRASAPAGSMQSAKFLMAQTADQWVFSKFKGTDVIGPNNEHIGDVNDLVFDKGGKINGVVVGVGGFLGIGEKNVAIDLAAFQVVPADSNKANDPNSVKLKVSWTKDELKNAPAFQHFNASSSPTTGMAPRDRAPAGGAPAPIERAPATTPAPAQR